MSRATDPDLGRLSDAWARSDWLFSMLAPDAWLEQPIPLRQPFLFYLGHLPAFAWNQCRSLFGASSFRPELDRLFERGIDPVGIDAYQPETAWPERAAVIEYRDRVRSALLGGLGATPTRSAEAGSVVTMVIEHELMHHETLLYMVQELAHERKRRPEGWPALPAPRLATSRRSIAVPEGEAVLGTADGSLGFGWDNEFPEQRVRVPAFAIDDRPVSNSDWLEFTSDGGYDEPRLWREADWTWRTRVGLERPHSWRGAGERSPTGLLVRSVLEDVPFERASGWPVMVSWAEAQAYCRWRGGRLPSEAEWHRAASGAPLPAEAGAAETAANVGFRHGSPLPAGSQPETASRWGVLELFGNGWEWTSSAFAPFPGFRPLPRYPGYSADFFDGSHFVMLGGSWATDARLLRRSFRNWFQPHYPYVFSKLRSVNG